MSTGLIVCLILVLVLLAVILVIAKAYSVAHKKLEHEREDHDKFERLFKFMGKWMVAEENGDSIVTKLQTMGKDIVVLGDNPVAQVLKSKLDKAGIAYRAEEEVEACAGAGIVLVTDISRYEKWRNKLDKIGVKSVSVEDVFYDACK